MNYVEEHIFRAVGIEAWKNCLVYEKYNEGDAQNKQE